MKTHVGIKRHRIHFSAQKKRNPLRYLLISFILLLVFATPAFTLSPVPASMLTRLVFSNGIAVKPDNYDEIKDKVTIIKNLEYPSNYKDNLVDLYIPNQTEAPTPIVIWIHGGAFVGGDKSDIEIYATSLAAEGIAVACINYRRAPEAKYPAPLIQTAEAYIWLKDIANTYSIDINRIILAGDSAGAHIAAQLAAVQTNSTYAAELELEQVIPQDSIKAVLLFCGPFEIAKMDEISSPTINFFMNRTAWAYFGQKNWQETFEHKATIANHITGDFPPAFITDGNTFSFEEHGMALAKALEKNAVPAEVYFIPPETETAPHEYQFIMNTPAAQESFEKVIAFVKEYTG